MPDRPLVRPVRSGDAGAICALYNHYVANTVVSFEEDAVSRGEMARRIAEVTSGYPWFVYEDGEAVRGFAYAGRWKTRSAYRYCAESTVYVDKDYVGRGIGTSLYSRLLDELRERDLRTVMAVIAQPNPGSAALHRASGFREAGVFTGVGFKFGTWIDVAYWQLSLRSGD